MPLLCWEVTACTDGLPGALEEEAHSYGQEEVVKGTPSPGVVRPRDDQAWLLTGKKTEGEGGPVLRSPLSRSDGG